MTEDKSNSYNYAPVLITTLNRYNHLRRCLESLERCDGAIFTDVYVALDFPPSDSYIEDWKRTDSYLASKETDNRFKSFNVIRRDHNYGICKKGNNFSALYESLKDNYDRFIISEDDNLFAPSFLNFINWGLEKFKNNKEIFSVCGYMYPLCDDHDFSFIKMDQFSAWGYGVWKDRFDLYKKYEDNIELVRDFFDDVPFVKRLKKKNKLLLLGLLDMYNTKQIMGDSLINSLQVKYNMSAIFPSFPLVSNKGWDGSGSHGGVVKSFENETFYKGNIDFSNLKSVGSERANQLSNKIKRYSIRSNRFLQSFLADITIFLYERFHIYYNFSAFRRVWKFFR